MVATVALTELLRLRDQASEGGKIAARLLVLGRRLGLVEHAENGRPVRRQNGGRQDRAGVAEGARTGLASVVTGLLFLLATVFAPLVEVIPNEAAVAALVLVGFLMMQQVKHIEWDDVEIAIPEFLTIALMPSFSACCAARSDRCTNAPHVSTTTSSPSRRMEALAKGTM